MSNETMKRRLTIFMLMVATSCLGQTWSRTVTNELGGVVVYGEVWGDMHVATNDLVVRVDEGYVVLVQWGTNAVQLITQRPMHTNGVKPSKNEIRKAKNIYRKAHPRCAACGVRRSPETGHKNHVHHIKKVADYPFLSADTNNMVTTCAVHHRIVGHPRGTHKANEHVVRDLELLNAIYDRIKDNKTGDDQ